MGSVSAVCPSVVRCKAEAPGKPHNKPEKHADRCYSEIFRDYLKEWSGVKNVVFKSSTQLLEGISMYNPSMTGAAALGAATKQAKNLGEASMLPKATKELFEKTTAFTANPSVHGLGGIINKLAGWYVPFWDAFNAVTKIAMPLTDRVAKIMGAMGSSATLTAMSFGINEEMTKIAKSTALIAKDKASKVGYEAQITNSHITIARNLNYAALGAFGLAATILGMTAPPLLMWTFATGGVSTTIGAHVHKEKFVPKAISDAVDPDKASKSKKAAAAA